MGDDPDDEVQRRQEAVTRQRGPSIGLVDVVPVEGVPAWSVRVTVPHADGPVPAWVPMLFWSPSAGEQWLAAKARHQLRPAVRACEHGPDQLGYAVVLDERGDHVLTSAPLRRVKAAGVAALLAAELRARARIS